MDFDVSLLHHLNDLASTPIAHEYLDFFGNDAFARGGPIFLVFLYTWFSKQTAEERAVLLIGFGASFAAVFTSVALQFLITPHVRPFMAPALGITSQIQDMHLHREGSFPSDTASLYFAISTVVFLQSRWAGLFCAAWSFLTVGLCRVALGYHYPSDILGGAVLGSALVLAASRWRVLPIALQRALDYLKVPPFGVNAIMCIVLADGYNQFFGFLGVFHILRFSLHPH